MIRIRIPLFMLIRIRIWIRILLSYSKSSTIISKIVSERLSVEEEGWGKWAIGSDLVLDPWKILRNIYEDFLKRQRHKNKCRLFIFWNFHIQFLFNLNLKFEQLRKIATKSIRQTSVTFGKNREDSVRDFNVMLFAEWMIRFSCTKKENFRFVAFWKRKNIYKKKPRTFRF